MKRFLAFFFVGGILVLLAAYPSFAERIARYRTIQEISQVSVPDARRVPENAVAKGMAKNGSLLPEVNWDVPFTPQAPHALWDTLHKEACEEASVLMVLRFFGEKPFESPDDADREIQRLVAVNERELGYPVDQTAQQVAQLIAHENPNLRISVVASPSVDQLKLALSHGFLAIVPAAGRQLRNPYFQNPGPVYHMLVIRGYTANGYAITNDPGTKRGEEFLYRWDRLLEAIHDWNGGDVERGEKVVILVGPYVIGDMN